VVVSCAAAARLVETTGGTNGSAFGDNGHFCVWVVVIKDVLLLRMEVLRCGTARNVQV